MLRPTKYYISLKALVRDGNRALVQWNNELQRWDIPGGRRHGTEDIDQGFRREIREELGCEIGYEPRPFKVWVLTSGERGRSTVYLGFITRLKLQPKALESGTSLKWVDLEELAKLDMPAPHREVLKEFLKS